jgi:hypothetical protein
MYFVEMKTFIKLASLLPIFLVFVFQTGLTSCKKDPLNSDTVTIIKHDTVTLTQPDTLLTTAILASHPWRVYEQRGVRGNTYFYYLRGGSGNTESLDNASLKFNSDQTGIHTSNTGGTLNFTWTFTNTEHTKLTYTLLNTPTTFTITWNNVKYKNGNLYIEEYYQDANTGLWAHYNIINMP